MAEGGQDPPTSISTTSEECSRTIRTIPADAGSSLQDSIAITSQEDYEDCSLCLDTGRHTAATKFCVDCSKYLCVTCLDYHGRFPTTSYHQVIDVEVHAASGPGNQHAFLPSEQCPEHRLQLIDTYCQTCDVVCCGTCVALHHKTKACHILYIAEAAVGIKDSQAAGDIQRDIQSSCVALLRKKKAQEDAIRKIDQERDEAKREINDYRQQIKQHFDELEKKALEKVDEKHKAATDKLTGNTKLVDHSVARIEKNLYQIQNFNSNNEVQLFSYIKTAKTNVAQANTILNTIEAHKTCLSFTFKKEPNIISSIPTIGAVDTISEDDREMLSVQQESHLPLDKETDHSACHVLSSCTLKNGQTLMADRFNMKLKQFDEMFQFVEECPVTEYPWAICETEPGQAAMTLPASSTIQLFSTRHSITPTVSIKIEPYSFSLKYHLKGLAYYGGNLYVTCTVIRDNVNAEIRVYDMSGTFLQVLTDNTLKKYLTYPTNITVSRDGKRIIIADFTKGVIVIDMQGNTIKTINSEHLDGGFGVCLGDNNRVFACGYGSNNVIQFDTNGGAVRQLLKLPDDGPKPMSLCYNTTTKTLAVTRAQCDIISAFQLVKKNVEG